MDREIWADPSSPSIEKSVQSKQAVNQENPNEIPNNVVLDMRPPASVSGDGLVGAICFAGK
jgi:hypothetical protein